MKKSLGILIICILFCNAFFIVTIPPAQTQENLTTTQEITKEKINTLSNAELFDQKISLCMKLARFPSLSACVIKDNEIFWEKSYGYYDLANKKQSNKDTIYVLASITKTIVGTALMQLYEQGFFELDQDVNTVLPFSLRNPYFPNEPITFRMLLSHTSSLNMNNQETYYWTNYSEDPPFPFFPEPFLEEFLIPGGQYYDDHVWSDIYKPGEQAMYANIGFDIISFLVELLSGQPFLDYCDQHIFQPLEMQNTSFNLSRLPIEQVSLPYFSFFLKYYQIDELDFLFKNATPPQPYWKIRAYPAGGLYSSINDFSHFLIAHMNEGVYKETRILEKETVELMHTIQPDNAIGYGLAWMQYPIDKDTMATGHGGDIMGADTWMLYDQEQDIGVIYFANGNPYYGYNKMIGSFAIQLLLQSLFEKGEQVSPSIYSVYSQVISIIKYEKISDPPLLFSNGK